MRELPAAGDLPIHILFDEFGHCQIPEFQTIITTIRKYRVSLSLILQSVSQLRQRYGNDAATTILEGGINGKLFYAGLDTQTAKMVEEMLGNVTYAEPYRKESLLSAYSVRTMDKDEAIFLSGNKPPVKMETRPSYTQRRFVKAEKYGMATVEDLDHSRKLRRVEL